MMYFIIGFASFISGIISTYLYIKERSKNENYKRRGLILRKYSVTTLGNIIGNIDVTYEVGEIDRTLNKSKVKVISAISSESDSDYQSLIKMIDNSWVNSSEIEWIEATIEDVRDKKISELLK
jgi:hypothetical protein